MGKSAILSAWLARSAARGAVVPHHFIRRQVIDWDQPEVIAASLAAQIEAVFPALSDHDARPEGRLIELLGRVSKQSGGTRRLVIVVDGLDETRAEPGDNPLPRSLPHVMPAGIRFLCATRPTYPHLNWLEARSPVRRLDLDDARWAASNQAVVCGFWEAVSQEYQPPLSAETTTTAITRAEGNVLHAVMLHDALRDMHATQRRADRVPRGLKALIGEIWDRAASHAAVRVGLGLLCAAREALALEVLADVAAWSYDEKQSFVREARQLLLEEPAAWAGVEAYRPRHDWVRELIAERLGTATVRQHHATLARTLATWPAHPGATARRYALRHALHHRAEAGDLAGAWELAAEMSFLEARVRAVGVWETETELAQVATHCRGIGEEALGKKFGDLTRALARESHWLRVTPEATAALVWNRLRQMEWSANQLNGQLAVQSKVGFLRVRSVAARQSSTLIRDLIGHTEWVRACVVTPDGQRVVSASGDKTLRVWDLESGRALATLEGHARWVSACAVTPDGRRVVSASTDQTLKVWDLESGRVLATLEGHTNRVNACAVTPDGRRVVSASEDDTLKVWDLESGRVLATLEGHTDGVNACAVTPDGRRVISASKDATLKVWDLESGRELANLGAHAGWVNACAVTPDGRRVISASDGRRVISASEDQTLKVWDLESGRALATLEGHADVVSACTVTPDGRRVISTSGDQTLKVWDLESGRVLATLEGHAYVVSACAVTPDGRRVVSASGDETLKVWDLESRRALATLEGHADGVTACAATPDGQYVISASEDETLKVWDRESGRALATLEGHADGVTACAVTPDGRRVVSASTDQTLKVWDLKSGRALAVLEDHADGVTACAVMPDGRRVVSASEGKLKLWDLESGRALATLEGHARGVNACAVTPDGQRVISASKDGTLKVWDLESGHALATLKGHARGVNACAVTPDGWRVVSASHDKTLKVWDLESGRALATLEAHADWVRACAVTPDGRRVVSASHDKTLKVWDLKTYACLFTHYGDAAFAAVTATETSIVVGDNLGSIWFLDWPPKMAEPTS